MKTLILTLIIAFAISKLAIASDPLNVGIKIGTGSSILSTNVDDILNMNISELPINKYHYGVFARGCLGKFYIQPEIYFNTKGGEISTLPTSGYDVINATSEMNFSTVDIPVLIGYKLIDRELLNMRFFVGPLFSKVVSKKFPENFENLSTNDLKEQYTGWQFGIGVDVWFLTIDARVEGTNNIFNDYSEFDAKSRVYLLTAGIKIF